MPNKTDRIVAEINRDPSQSSAQIAKSVGVTAAYVGKVAHRHSLTYGTKGVPTNKITLPPMPDWIHKEITY